MMDLWNVMKGAGLASASQFGQNRWGTVTNVKQTNSGYEAKVLLQPEGVPSGWLPVLSHAVGAGWGVVAPPSQGMQAFIAADTGDGHHGVIIGLSYSLQAAPPVPPNAFDQPNGTPVQAGEIALVSQSGGIIRLCSDGSIHIQGPIRIDGNLTIQGDVAIQASSSSGATGTLTTASDITSSGNVADVHGTVESFRVIFNEHVHGTGGPTPTPTVPD